MGGEVDGKPEALGQGSPLTVLESWARDRYGLRWPLRAEVLKLIKSYQERPGEPRPFVGRGPLLQQLDEWLLQGEDRLRLLSAPAGRGKSALLLHWMGRLIQHKREITIFYLPISIRFNMADEAAGVQLLFAALCDVFGDLKKLPQQPEIQDYIQGIASAWQQMALKAGQAFLLVVDGLDEAIDRWFLKRHLLPRPLPPNLHVLIAARHKPGHANGTAWLEDLDGAGASENQVLEMGPLEPQAMAEAVIRLGHPLDRLAERQFFLQNLYRVTDHGDPLLLTLWLGQIWRKRDAVPDLDAEALARLQPGFGDFYNLWMKEQRWLWGAMGLSIQADAFKQVMHVLALAQGRLLTGELVEVLSHLGSPASWDSRQLSAVLETAHRLVVGDATGYVLVHPRLAQYFQEELDADPQQRDAVRGAFRRWGASVVQRLNSGELPPEECPAYLLTHYLAVHISAGEGSGPQTLERYLPLLGQGWPRAWHAREGAWNGYLSDLDRVARRLHELNQMRARAGRPGELAAEVRCALLAASVRSLIDTLPAQLLVALARESVWSLSRAARVARGYEPDQQGLALTELAAVATEQGQPAEAQSLLQEALQTAATLPDAYARASILNAVAAHLQGATRRTILQQALEAAVASEHAWQHSNGLCAVAAQSQGDSELLQQVLTAAASEGELQRVEILSTVAAHLQGEARRTVLQQALEVAAVFDHDTVRAYAVSTAVRQIQADATLLQQALNLIAPIQDDEARSNSLSVVATQLPANSALLEQVLTAAAAIKRDSWRVGCLSKIAPVMQGEARRTVLQQALAAALASQDESDRAAGLREVAPLLEADSALLQQALAAAAAIKSDLSRACTLSAVATALQGDAQRRVLEQAVEAAAAIQRDDDRAQALRTVAAQLQGEAQRTVLQQALEAAAATQVAHLRYGALFDLTGPLQGEARRTALQLALGAAAAIRDGEEELSALTAIAGAMQGEARRTVLHYVHKAAAAIQDEQSRAKALLLVAARLQGDGQRTVLEQALEAAAAVRDEMQRTVALSAVAAQLQGHSALLQQALEAAAAIQTDVERAVALSAVGAQLQGEARHTVLQQALTVVGVIEDEHDRSRGLCAVAEASRGDSALLQEALKMAAPVQHESSRAMALDAIVRQLQGDSALLQQARTVAATIPYANFHARFYLDVAQQLQGEAQLPDLRQAQNAAAAIQDDEWRAEALSALAARLQGATRQTVLQQALEAAAGVENEALRARALGVVASELQGDSARLEQALQAAAAIQHEGARASALSAVAAHLQADGALLQQALQAAAGIQDKGQRAYVLSAVATRLQGELKRTILQQALEAVGVVEYEDEHLRARVLSTVAAQSPQEPELQAVCLETALTFPATDRSRIELSMTLVRQNPSFLTYERWSSLLSQARLSRPQLLGVIGDLTWCAVQLTGRAAEAEEIASAVHDVCGWFP